MSGIFIYLKKNYLYSKTFLSVIFAEAKAEYHQNMNFLRKQWLEEWIRKTKLGVFFFKQEDKA
jgi:hypothetical protein